MKLLNWLVVLLLSSAHSVANADVSAPKLLSQYDFAGNLNDLFNRSSLTAFGPENDGHDRNNATSGFGTDQHGTYWFWTSTLPRGGGFWIDIDEDISEQYSVGVRFAFNETGPSWKKIIDYKNSTSDNGFYFYSGGKLQFYPHQAMGSTSVLNNQLVDVIATRTAEGRFEAYFVVDGVAVKELEVDDSARRDAVPQVVDGKTRFGFFFDDLRTGDEATSGGRVYSIRVWDGRILEAEVETALETVTAPATASPDDILQARRLRADAASREMRGDIERAIELYEASLTFLHDEEIAAKIAELRSAVDETAEVTFEIGNIYTVRNNPIADTVFTLQESRLLVSIENYHWNSARGKEPGTIGLRDAAGKTYGPWDTEGRAGQGGVPNAYWTARPMILLPAGTYTVLDSDPASWSHNYRSGGRGFTRVKTLPARAQPGVDSSLIAYYKLDGNAEDHSGHGNHGRVQNAEYVPAKLGLGLELTGEEASFLEVPFDASLNTPDGFTFSAWAKVNRNRTSYSALIYRAGEPPTSERGWMHRIFVFWVMPNGRCGITTTADQATRRTTLTSDSGSFSYNEFTHFAGTVNPASKTVSIYVNGVKIKEGPFDGERMRGGEHPMRIGGYFQTMPDQSGLTGVIDEVRLYNRALNESEIQQLYSALAPDAPAGINEQEERVEAEAQRTDDQEAARQTEAQRTEQERAEAERVERERQEQERAEAERVEQERQEQERTDREKAPTPPQATAPQTQKGEISFNLQGRDYTFQGIGRLDASGISGIFGGSTQAAVSLTFLGNSPGSYKGDEQGVVFIFQWIDGAPPFQTNIPGGNTFMGGGGLPSEAQVTVTEYGGVGEMIRGSFSSHSLRGTFAVPRDQ